MKIPPRSTDSRGRTPSRRWGRNHRADALHVREDGADGPQDDRDEENPPSETWAPRPSGWRAGRARGSPEPVDREGPDVRRCGPWDRDDRKEEGDQGDPEDDETEDQETERRHGAAVFDREENEDNREDDEQHEIEQVRRGERARDRAVRGEGRAVRQDLGPVPCSTAIPIRREGRPREGADIRVRADGLGKRPEREREGHQDEEDRQAEGDSGGSQREHPREPGSPSRSGGHWIPLKQGGG